MSNRNGPNRPYLQKQPPRMAKRRTIYERCPNCHGTGGDIGAEVRADPMGSQPCILCHGQGLVFAQLIVDDTIELKGPAQVQPFKRPTPMPPPGAQPTVQAEEEGR